MALVHSSAIYEADVRHAIGTLQEVAPNSEVVPPEIQQDSLLPQLIANLRTEHLAQPERIPSAAIEREYDLVQFQIHSAMAWTAALRRNRFSTGAFRRKIATYLRVQQWLGQQAADRVRVTADECVQFYGANLETYSLPVRSRASHLFLAAPPETPPEVVDAKQDTIEAISARIVGGEHFADLVPLYSEDEATKMRAGDLGYFSESRMPADFLDPIRNMRVGETSRVVRTYLGFHIIQLTDVKAGRQMTFEESRAEIGLTLENQKRVAVVDELITELSREGGFIRIFPW